MPNETTAELRAELLHEGADMLERASSASGKETIDQILATLAAKKQGQSASQDQPSWMTRFHLRFSEEHEDVRWARFKKASEESRAQCVLMIPNVNDAGREGVFSPLTKAEEVMYHHLMTVLMCLHYSCRLIKKSLIPTQEQVKASWKELCKAVPKGSNDRYKEEEKVFRKAFKKWLSAVKKAPRGFKETVGQNDQFIQKLTQSELLKRQNREFHQAFLDQGYSPGIILEELRQGDYSRMNVCEVASCQPLSKTVLHNQLQTKELRFGAKLSFEHAGRTYQRYAFTPPLHFTKKASKEQRAQEVRDHHQQFREAAGIDEGKLLYIFDFRANHLGFNKAEAKSWSATKEAFKKGQDNTRHIAIPFVEIFVGSGFPLGKLSKKFDSVWRYPLWAFLKGQFPAQMDTQESKSILSKWLSCVNVMQGSEAKRDRQENFYQHYKALVKKMYEAESAELRQLAQIAIFSLRYHASKAHVTLSDRRLFEYVDETLACEGLDQNRLDDNESRHSESDRWVTRAIWVVALEMLAFALSSIQPSIVTAIIALALPFVIAFAVYAVWKSYQCVRPSLPVARSPYAYVQYHSALTAVHFDSGMLHSAMLGFIEKIDPNVATVFYCKSSKDRTSMFFLLDAYRLACEHVANACQKGKVERLDEPLKAELVSVPPSEKRIMSLDSRVKASLAGISLNTAGEKKENIIDKAAEEAKQLMFRTLMLLRQRLMLYAGVQGGMDQPLARLWKHLVPQPNPDRNLSLIDGSEHLKEASASDFEDPAGLEKVSRLRAHMPNVDGEEGFNTVFSKLYGFFGKVKAKEISPGAAIRNRLYY